MKKLALAVSLFLFSFSVFANHAPTMNGDQRFFGTQNTSLFFKLAGASDADKDSLTYSLVTAPNVGELKNCFQGSNSLNCEFVPPQDFFGTINFSYRANDGQSDSFNISRVSLKFNLPTHIPQVGADQSFQTSEDVGISFKLNEGSDANGDKLSYQLVSPPTHGVLKNCANGTRNLICYFQPDSHYYGPVSFSYVAHDGISPSNSPATVTCSV